MKYLTTNDEIERLCEAMIRDFLKSRHCADALCVDIETFVTQYLGIPVVYESFAELDPGRIGFLSDGIRPLRVWRDHRAEPVVFPEGTVVIEKYLLDPKENARKRFTISHEGSHHVLRRHTAADPAAAFCSEFDREAVYQPQELRDRMSVYEFFANRAAACFLMPRFLVLRVLKRFNGSKKVVVFEGGVVSRDQKLLMGRMADAMGVSYSAFYTRLRELDLFEVRPVEEYIYGCLCFGGGAS